MIFTIIIFTMIILNSFTGRLPISTSFSCFSGALSCPLIWDITLWFFILINFLKCGFHSSHCGIVALWPEIEPISPALKVWRCLDIIWAKQPDSLSQYQWSTPSHPCYFPWHFPMSKNLAQKKYRECWVREVSEPQSLRALKLGLEDSMCWEWEMGFTESPGKFWGNQDLDMEYRWLRRETRDKPIRKLLDITFQVLFYEHREQWWSR